jgi:galactokinase
MRSFEALYGGRPAVHADAPGRVNLIGEHTDYSGGFVFPTAIPQRTYVQLSPRPDSLVRCWSAQLSGSGEPLQYELGAERPIHGWLDYVMGVTHALRVDGHRISGFDLRVESAVPVGSGLSSSAALEVSVLRALRELFGLRIEDVHLALLGQQAENDFVGARVGNMDQLAASLADTRTALFVDTRSLVIERLSLPASVELVVIDSGVKHNHASGEYNRRREQCERAAALLGVDELRDTGIHDLPRIEDLPEPLNRRARHVVTENARVLDARDAIRSGDLDRLGSLFDSSHRSLRDDYEVSTPELDLLVKLATVEPDVYGARMTGGGFGGSVVLLITRGLGRDVSKRVARIYTNMSRRSATVLVPPG